jgi:hypothetical protein
MRSVFTMGNAYWWPLRRKNQYESTRGSVAIIRSIRSVSSFVERPFSNPRGAHFGSNYARLNKVLNYSVVHFLIYTLIWSHTYVLQSGTE